MKEVELILLVGGLTKRVLGVEGAVDMIKTQQQGHDSQIETLALEFHGFRQEMYEFRDEAKTKFQQIDAQFIAVHNRMDAGFTRIDDQFREMRAEMKEMKFQFQDMLKSLARIEDGQRKTG